MQSFRGIYRNVFAETILLAAVLVQIISGIRLFKAGGKTALGFYDKLHYRTGLYMASFLVIHVSAVLAGRYILKLDTNFYFGVAGLNSFPFNLFFIPYYGLAIFSFFGHIAAVHSKKMKTPLLGLLPKQQANIILASGFIITMIIFYGLTNHFKGVLIPAEYNILTGK